MFNRELNTKYIYYLIVLVLIVIAGIFYLLTMDRTEMTMVLEQEEPSMALDVSAATVAEEMELIYIHICGHVKSPEVYKVKKGSRLFEVVEKAGGLSADASESSVNMARVVQDGEKIYVSSIEEAQVMKSSGGQDTGAVSINDADEVRLMTLPGIGQSKARAIIQYREEHGMFEKIEDIMLVGGIKEAMYDKIKEYISL